MGFKKKTTRHRVKTHDKNWDGTTRKPNKLRGRNRAFKKIANKIYYTTYSHKYWGDSSLRYALLCCTDEFCDNNLMDYPSGFTCRPVLKTGRKITDEEVYAIAERICGYNTGGELFPPHLTREESILFLEVTSMIEETFKSMCYFSFRASELGASYECNDLIGVFAGKKGELIHDWLALCTAGKTDEDHLCYFCAKHKQSKSKLDDHRARIKTVAEESVTAFRIASKVKERLNKINWRNEDWTVVKTDTPFLKIEFIDETEVVLKLDEVQALAVLQTKLKNAPDLIDIMVAHSVALLALEKFNTRNKFGLAKFKSITHLLSKMTRKIVKPMKPTKYDEYKLIFAGLDALLADLDREIYPKFKMPEPCDCDDCVKTVAVA
mgnify:CR=1 FL=1